MLGIGQTSPSSCHLSRDRRNLAVDSEDLPILHLGMTPNTTLDRKHAGRSLSENRGELTTGGTSQRPCVEGKEDDGSQGAKCH